MVVDSSYNAVSCGSSRQIFLRKGLIVGFVDLWTGWSEEAVVQCIESAFNGVIATIQHSTW